ncbi:uncharacterized protein LOC129742264 [Uranotaenia lowii]|uniref:uncharacterized protein LOC129742264 n=1 Tax=Uranotaenia lowii TaxID=190385 RepID=UPI0024785841|nr:uncharacterized protein LOC129742264 [Uranotaenia lowii]
MVLANPGTQRLALQLSVPIKFLIDFSSLLSLVSFLLPVSCPPPLKPRDFVLQRSWLDTGPEGEQMLLSRSVPHKNYPPKKGYVRATSYITGFVLRTNDNSKAGCILKYVAHCDPQGTLPPWLVNKVTHTLGPRMVKDLKKAALGYVSWKNSQPHLRKPWRFPEEISCPRISIDDCLEESAVPVPRMLPSTPSVVTAASAKPSVNGEVSTGRPSTVNRILPIAKSTVSTPTSLPKIPVSTTASAKSSPSPTTIKSVVGSSTSPSSSNVNNNISTPVKEKSDRRWLLRRDKSEQPKQNGNQANGTNGTAGGSSKKEDKKLKKESKDDSCAKDPNKKKEGGLKKRRSLLSLKF